MTGRTRRAVAMGLLAAALALSLLGQSYFFSRREFLWDGLVLHVLAVVCFLLAWRLSVPPGPALSKAGGRHLAVGRWPIPALLLAAALGFSLFATLLVRSRAWDQWTGDAVALWLAGVLLAVAAALWPAHRPAVREQLGTEETSPAMGEDSGPVESRRTALVRRIRRLPRQAWIEIAAIATLTLLAFVLRVSALSSVPFTLGGDEAWHGLLARQVMDGELRNPFVMGYMSMPTFFYWPLSWTLALVNDVVAGLRLLAVLAGTATVPVFYGLVRSLWGRRTALLSAAFLAAYEYHIHFSRLGANNVWDPLFVIVALWGLDRALATGRPEGWGRARPLIVAGLSVGFSFYFYTGARLLPVLLVAYAAIIWLERKSTPEGGLSPAEVARALALIGLVAIIVAGPMLEFALAHPDDWNARINQIGILQSGWLAREPGLTGKTTAQVLAEQFLRSAGAFHVFTDRTVWYAADRPLLGFVPGMFALLGMAWAAVHWRERRYALLLLWFWAVILSGGMLTEGPPASQRLVMAIPAVCVLVVIGLEETIVLGRRLLGGRPVVESAALAVIVAALAASSIGYYFYELMPARTYGSENGETATMMGRYVQRFPPGTRVYLFGAPRIYWNFGTMGFLAPQIEGYDVVDPLIGVPALPAATGEPTLFVFLPERAAEMRWVQQAYPGGQVREFSDRAGQARFIVYEIPP